MIVAGTTGGSLGGPNAGGPDAFLARYDENGNRLWIRQFGTYRGEQAAALAPDGAGGVVVAGFTQANLGGPNAGYEDAFMARYDSADDFLWIRQFGSSSADWAAALAPDGTGGVMVAGSTDGSLSGPSAGMTDAFVARYDSAGNQLWIRQFGTSADDRAYALAPDGTGGVMVAGSTLGSLGGPSAGFGDAFLARYDETGHRLWIRQFGTSMGDGATSLAPDGAGGVIVVGVTGGSLGGPNAGRGDVFLARYNGAGERLWIRQFGTSEPDWAFALAPDGAGGVIVAGTTEGSLGGANAGYVDAFLARYDGAGHRLWLRQFGTSMDDIARALAADGTGGVVVAGYTGAHRGGPAGQQSDVFLARYTIDSCYANCDQSTGNEVLDIFDFLCFQNDFVTGNSYACDCDTSTGPLVCDMLDFLCFQKAFVGGCP
ncbi:MAG: hypothetical protein IID31_06365 [Planctomycetes bacterium]|nr:hypothetical protein [Planctomycetota bacterium]